MPEIGPIGGLPPQPPSTAQLRSCWPEPPCPLPAQINGLWLLQFHGLLRGRWRLFSLTGPAFLYHLVIIINISINHLIKVKSRFHLPATFRPVKFWESLNRFRRAVEINGRDQETRFTLVDDFWCGPVSPGNHRRSGSYPFAHY